MPGQIWFIPMVPTQLLTALHPQKCSQLVGKVLWSSYWLEVIGPKIQIRRKPDSCPERVHENGRGTQENGWLQYKSKGDICYNIRMSIHTQKSWHVNRVLEDEWEWSTLDTKGQVMLERGQHPKWSDREEPLCHTSFCMKDSRSTHISTNDPISFFLYGWVILHCRYGPHVNRYVPHFLYPFICFWTFRLY